MIFNKTKKLLIVVAFNIVVNTNPLAANIINNQLPAQIKGNTLIVTVGSAGSSCDITTGTTKVQDAINMAAGTIRLVNTETYTENIIIADISTNIIGGFSSCADAENGIRNATDTSNIQGVNESMLATIIITGNNSSNTVELVGLDIANGEGGFGVDGGGIGILSASANIILRNLFIHDNNTGENGGGIAMNVGSANTNLFIFDSIISSNQSNLGGGLYCRNLGAALNPIIEVRGLSGFSDNSSAEGGGVYLDNCDFTSYSGESDITSDVGINRNSSTGRGGGIYAINGSKINLNGHEICGLLGCSGTNLQPVTIASNSAQDNGGGIFLSGFLTTLEMNSVYLTENTTEANGGGMALSDGATLTVSRLEKECWDENHCNFFTYNKSGSSTGFGGLIYNENSTANIYQAEIAFNRADFGTVLYGIGTGSITILNGNVIRDNGGIRFGSFPHDDTYIFRVISGAQVDVYHSTIADNGADNAVFGIGNNAGTTSEIVNSIVHDVSTGTLIEPFIGSQFLVKFEKSIVHEKNSLDLPALPNTDLDIMLADPMFVNSLGNNYHINPINSPAIDFAAANFSNLEDIDFEARGIDNPNVNDLHGPYDIGADESRRPNEMFKDGFEN